MRTPASKARRPQRRGSGAADLERSAHSRKQGVAGAPPPAERARELAYLLHQCQTRNETFRRELGRHVHDEIAQKVSSLAIDFASLQLKGAGRRKPADFTALSHVVHDVIQAIRRLSKQLYPKVLETFGFTAALEWLVRDTQNRSHGAQFQHSLQEGEVPEPIAILLFRASEELLHNIELHARAKSVRVELSFVQGDLVLAFCDDGVGFDARQRPRTYGLLSVIHQVEALHGEIEIDSSPGRGTAVRVRVPLSREATKRRRTAGKRTK